MTARTHVAALADRVHEAAGRLAVTQNELDVATKAFEDAHGWAPAIMLSEIRAEDCEILETIVAIDRAEIDAFIRGPRAPRLSRRNMAAWRRELHERFTAAAAAWEAERRRALGGLEKRRADQAAALARDLRRLRRARVSSLGDIAAKLRVVAELPAELCEPDALARSAIRDLGDVGRIAP